MSIGLKQLKKCETIEDLENLGMGYLTVDLGYRGGKLGFSASSVTKQFGISGDLMPKYIGAYSNYLGGGLRGSICVSTYDSSITGRRKQLLDALLDACKRAYINAENEDGLNEEEYSDGETNWEAKGTNASRLAGVVSAY